MQQYVLPLTAVDQHDADQVGGKAANLGELQHISGVFVPEGFCVTVSAFQDFLAVSDQMNGLLTELELVRMSDTDRLQQLGARIRNHLETLPIPLEIQEAVKQVWRETGAHFSYAIRSSATAEDLPGASFAGQQDTFLNITGFEDVLRHIRKCWASLFTDRAIVYRIQNGFQHRAVYLAVVVQRMIFPEVSGILFTADPVSGNRNIVSIDASYGLGEALVSGIVSADLYQIRDGELIYKKVADKKVAVYGLSDGGVVTRPVVPGKRTRQALPDQVALVLAELGQKIAAHFGRPQDIEWCMADDTLFIVQSRPITTLYPVPQFSDDQLHILVSLGHAQMMTEPIKPLGISVLRTFMPIGKNAYKGSESRLLVEAGGRLYIDLSEAFQYRLGRKLLPALIRNADETIGRALQVFNQRMGHEKTGSNKKISFALTRRSMAFGLKVFKTLLYRKESGLIERIGHLFAQQLELNRDRISRKKGVERIKNIQALLPELFPFVFSHVGPYVATGVLTFRLIHQLATHWLEDVDQELSGISKAPVGNVTSEMGLALGDVADSIRGNSELVEYLRHAVDAEFLTGLNGLAGGSGAREVFQQFLDKYGMRTTGEIDITRPRWREAPTQLVGAILSHVENSTAGEHRKKFQQGEQLAEEAAHTLLKRLKFTRWGFFKVKLMARLIAVYRMVIGLREHPKFFIVQNFDMIKQAILQEAQVLLDENILEQLEDIYWLTLDELIHVITTRQVDKKLLAVRREQFEYCLKLVPPRVMTSEGEILDGLSKSKSLSPDTLIGSPVSVGIVEGRARIVTNLSEAKLAKGDILVAPFTDPGWTPLFSLAAGLVTEAGGLMTHGAVVAREYGIPAVVGVDGATQKIKDGQFIRIDGRTGSISLLKEAAKP